MSFELTFSSVEAGVSMRISRWLISAVIAKLIIVETTIDKNNARGNSDKISVKLTIATMAGMKNSDICVSKGFAASATDFGTRLISKKPTNKTAIPNNAGGVLMREY